MFQPGSRVIRVHKKVKNIGGWLFKAGFPDDLAAQGFYHTLSQTRLARTPGQPGQAVLDQCLQTGFDGIKPGFHTL
jgi:hypothetical protein